ARHPAQTAAVRLRLRPPGLGPAAGPALSLSARPAHEAFPGWGRPSPCPGARVSGRPLASRPGAGRPNGSWSRGPTLRGQRLEAGRAQVTAARAGRLGSAETPTFAPGSGLAGLRQVGTRGEPFGFTSFGRQR